MADGVPDSLRKPRALRPALQRLRRARHGVFSAARTAVGPGDAGVQSRRGIAGGTSRRHANRLSRRRRLLHRPQYAREEFELEDVTGFMTIETITEGRFPHCL